MSAKWRTNAGIEELAQRIVNGLKLEIDEFVFEIRNAAPVQPVGEPVPWLLRCRPQFTPIEKDVALIGVQLEGEAAIEQFVARDADTRVR